MALRARTTALLASARRLRATLGGVLVVGALVASVAASPGLAEAGTPVAPPVAGPAADPDRFVPVAPVPLRAARAPLGPATERLPVLGRSGLPTGGVRDVVLTLTARSGARGAVTVWSGEGAPPTVPTLTSGPDRTATTTAIVPVGPDGRIAAVSAPVPADVTVDVTGWFPPSSSVVTGTPARLFDSTGATVDGRDARSGPVAAGTVRPLQVDGRGFGSSPAGSSVLLAVRSVRADTPSALTVWPGGVPQPTVPSVPVGPGGERSDLVYTDVGRDGQVDMALAEGRSDLAVDLLAVVPARSAVRPLPPARVFDSRPGTVTVDDLDGAAGALVPGAARRVPVVGRAGVPAGASAVLAHLTATATPSAPSELRAWADAAGPGPPAPAVSVGPGETRGGLVVLPVGPDGSIALRADGAPSDVAVDVQGWIGEDLPPRA